MKPGPLCLVAFLCATTVTIKGASAHHSAQAPRLTTPHSIGGVSELSMSLDAAQLPSAAGAKSPMLFRVRGDATLWIRPWISIGASLPLQALENSDGTMGLGNASLGTSLRGLFAHGFEVNAGADIRFPRLGGGGGADSQLALVPRLVAARRGIVTPYIGAAIVLGIVGDKITVDMAIPKKFRPRQNEDEVLGFIGASANRGPIEGLLELKGTRTLSGENTELYVAALIGAGVRISKQRMIRSTFEVPWRSANRLRWSAGLSFTQTL